MNAPPRILDGATLRLWSPLDYRHKKTTQMRLYTNGVEQLKFSGVAVGYYDKEESGVYLFYCDASWKVLNDSLYTTVAEAKMRAEEQFEGLGSTWIPL